MPKKRKSTNYKFTIRQKKFQVIADKVLFFRLLQRLHGRFWGVAAVFGVTLGFSVCFLIRPDLLHISTAFSDFGKDVRTAPYFAGTMFFAAYGLWRWRNYLSHTLKRPGPILGLLTCTIVGLYIVALSPVSVHPWPYRLHFFGVILAGVSMALTVVIDGLLTKTRLNTRVVWARTLRFCAFSMIIIGGVLTYGSSQAVHWFHVALLGESVLFWGYALWIYLKTVEGEGARSKISTLIQKIVIVK